MRIIVFLVFEFRPKFQKLIQTVMVFTHHLGLDSLFLLIGTNINCFDDKIRSSYQSNKFPINYTFICFNQISSLPWMVWNVNKFTDIGSTIKGYLLWIKFEHDGKILLNLVMKLYESFLVLCMLYTYFSLIKVEIHLLF